MANGNGNGIIGTGSFGTVEINDPLKDYVPSPFPETVGDARGKNGLRRTHYFDGRFLTASAFQRDQFYWDARSRIVAQTHPAGLAWGMELAIPRGSQPLGELTPMCTSAETLTLKPGVGFDDIGRPIVVGRSFQFTIEQLLERYLSSPQKVLGSGTTFAPCVCIEPGGGAGLTAGSIPQGTFLLLVEPSECPEGMAKVYGEACAASAHAQCDADRFVSGFGLSLARVEAPVSAELLSEGSWALRSHLGAWYNAVHKPDLRNRWPSWRTVRDFGPAGRVAGHIPLALLYVGENGDILFVDPWIPRRYLVESESRMRGSGSRGAPPAAVVVSRQEQFQRQLAEVLAVPGAWSASEGPKKSLLELDFRWLPPTGFLPIVPPPPGGDGEDLLGRAVSAAKTQVMQWFANTNVIVIPEVALHDDDLLEIVRDAEDKDLIRLDAPPDILTRTDAGESAWWSEGTGSTVPVSEHPEYRAEWFDTWAKPGSVQAQIRDHFVHGESTDGRAELQELLSLLGLPPARGPQLARSLADRDVALVRAIIVARGVGRRDPLVGVAKPGDAQAHSVDEQGSIWGDDLPLQPFVCFVKQRLVIPASFWKWLDAHRGPIGPRGEQGDSGPQGDPGPAGEGGGLCDKLETLGAFVALHPQAWVRAEEDLEKRLSQHYPEAQLSTLLELHDEVRRALDSGRSREELCACVVAKTCSCIPRDSFENIRRLLIEDPREGSTIKVLIELVRDCCSLRWLLGVIGPILAVEPKTPSDVNYRNALNHLLDCVAPVFGASPAPLGTHKLTRDELWFVDRIRTHVGPGIGLPRDNTAEPLVAAVRVLSASDLRRDSSVRDSFRSAWRQALDRARGDASGALAILTQGAAPIAKIAGAMETVLAHAPPEEPSALIDSLIANGQT
jgi:hypothetical protein